MPPSSVKKEVFKLAQHRKTSLRADKTASRSSRKGIGMAATVFLFMAVMLTVTLMVIFGAQGEFISAEVDVELDYRTGDVARDALASSIMNDHVWRIDEVEQCKYDNKLAKEILSDYFSTPGEELYIGDNAIAKSEVEEDLREYFDYKLDRHLAQSADSREYQLVITHGSNSIEVGDGSSGRGWGRSTFRAGVVGGEYAIATLVTEESGGSGP